MMDRYYLNDKGEPEPCEDLMEWAQKFEVGNRRVDETEIEGDRLLEEDLWISTVFLGIDHNWSGGPPVLWQTMVFVDGADDHPLHNWMDRCSGSREQALAMHQRLFQHVKEWRALDTLPRRLRRFSLRYMNRAREAILKWIRPHPKTYTKHDTE